jgi:hypothetical protein
VRSYLEQLSLATFCSYLFPLASSHHNSHNKPTEVNSRATILNKHHNPYMYSSNRSRREDRGLLEGAVLAASGLWRVAAWKRYVCHFLTMMAQTVIIGC